MTSPLPSENVLAIPKSWRWQLHPRRGGAPGPTINVAEQTEDELRSHCADQIQEAVDHPGTEPALAAAAREHLSGKPNPLGTAAIATVPGWRVSNEDMTVRFVDSWITTYGLSFAVHAFLERCGIEMGSEGDRAGALLFSRHFDEHRLAAAAKRLRALLAVVDEAEYREFVTFLAGRRTTPMERLLAAYLVPTELDWVAECCTAPPSPTPCNLLLCSLGSPEHLEILGAEARLSTRNIETFITLADGVGPAIAPYLAKAFDELSTSLRSPHRENLLGTMSRLPSDEAFRLTLQRDASDLHTGDAVDRAMRRFPVRATRILAAAATAGDVTAEDLLVDHLLFHATSVPWILPGLPAASRALVERLVALYEKAPEASLGELPRLLVEPPWTRTESKPKPVVLKGLTAPEEQAVVWAPGERDAWLRTKIFHPHPDSWHLGRTERGASKVGEVRAPQNRTQRWERWIAAFQEGLAEETHWLAGLLAMGPEELIGPALRGWQPGEWESPGGFWTPENWLKVLIARFELDALPVTLRFALAHPARGATLLLPFLDGEVANAMAGWILRTKTARDTAADWFARHGAAALPYLVPVALGKAGRARTAAEYALHVLAGQEGADAVIDAVRAHGEKAVALVTTLLAGDPEELRPRKKVPANIDIDVLAEGDLRLQVLLKGRKRALPTQAAQNVLTLLALSTPEEPDPGLAEVLEACDDRSLTDFGWALFRFWNRHRRAYGMSESAWQLGALAWLGDDEVVRKLVPLIRTWPGEGGHHHAVRGLDVLAAIGTDLALREIHAIAQKVKYKGLKKHAREKVRQIAKARGLTAEQLGDRLAPDFGLDADGTLALDYGPRRFTVGFDEALKPFVLDENGKRRAGLPKSGARDDTERAGAAYQRFAQLKKDVRAIAGVQIQHFELAMTTGRRWSLPEFREHLVQHPLVWHLARRLVWLARHDNRTTEFRIAEDRTFADVDDNTVTLPDQATISIPHPLHLPDTLNEWSQVFADYEILQPFPQLGRAVHTLTDQERSGSELRRFHDLTVPTGKVVGMERRGWQRGTAEDNGIQVWILRPLPGDQAIVVDLDPGIPVGDLDFWPQQRIERVSLVNGSTLRWHIERSPAPFSELDPVTASEIINDLTMLTT